MFHSLSVHPPVPFVGIFSPFFKPPLCPYNTQRRRSFKYPILYFLIKSPHCLLSFCSSPFVLCTKRTYHAYYYIIIVVRTIIIQPHPLIHSFNPQCSEVLTGHLLLPLYYLISYHSYPSLIVTTLCIPSTLPLIITNNNNTSCCCVFRPSNLDNLP